MHIATLTGNANPDVLTVTKGISSLVFHLYVAPSALTNERITVEIEKANGANAKLMTNVKLKHFVQLSTFGISAPVQVDNGAIDPYHALCELTLDGAIDLGANESIKITLSGLDPAKTLKVYGMEEPESTTFPLMYEVKTAVSEDATRMFDVSQYDLCLIEGFDYLTDFRMTYDNGTVCSYSKDELRAIQLDVDPIAEVSNITGLAKAFDPLTIIVPLVGVTAVEIIKFQTNPVGLTLRSEVHAPKAA